MFNLVFLVAAPAFSLIAPPAACVSRALVVAMERTPSAAEEKALRAVRKGFGFDGPYYVSSETDYSNSWSLARSDHPVLSEWSDEELKTTIDEMQSTPLEILLYSPLGPFFLLSVLAILTDGIDLTGNGKQPIWEFFQ